MFSSSYSPLHALAGGIMIGVAGLLVVLSRGKPPGISGMLGCVIRPSAGDWAWRLLFLAGLVGGAALSFQLIDAATLYRPVRSLAALVGAGLLVGFGTGMGGGCTSGHGVYGMSMGSLRSVIATLIFIGAAMATVYLLRVFGGPFAP